MSSTRTLSDTTEGLNTQTEDPVEPTEARPNNTRTTVIAPSLVSEEEGGSQTRQYGPYLGPSFPKKSFYAGSHSPGAAPGTACEREDPQKLENRLQGRKLDCQEKSPGGFPSQLPSNLENGPFCAL